LLDDEIAIAHELHGGDELVLGAKTMVLEISIRHQPLK